MQRAIDFMVPLGFKGGGRVIGVRSGQEFSLKIVSIMVKS